MRQVLADLRWWTLGFFVRNSRWMPFKSASRMRQSLISSQMSRPWYLG